MTWLIDEWAIHTCDMTLWSSAWISQPSALHISDMPFMCDMTHLHVNDYLYMKCHSYVTWLIHMWHDSFICANHRPSLPLQMHVKVGIFFPNGVTHFQMVSHICLQHESCMSHVPWFVWHESCPICMIQVTCVMSHVNDLCYLSPYARFERWGLGSRPKKMYGERLGDGVEYHLMKPTPHR